MVRSTVAGLSIALCALPLLLPHAARAAPCTVIADITANINGPSVTGSTAGAQDQADPSCVGSSAAGDAIYEVTPLYDGTLTASLDNPGTDYDEVIHVRTNCNKANSEVACDDTPGLVTFPVTAGTTYYIIVDGWSTAEGNYELTLTMTEGTCDDGIDNDTDGATDCEDVDCSGTAGCPSVCPVVGDATANINGAPLTGTTSGKPDYATGSCGGSGGAGDVVYTVTPAFSGLLTASLNNPGTTFDETIYVRSDCDLAGTELACDDVPGEVLLSVVGGQTYFIFVDGWGASEGAYELTLTMTEGTCDDALDNDTDGLTDCEDPDCSGVDGCPTTCTAPVVGQVTCTSDIDANTTVGSSSVLTGYDDGPCGGCCNQPNQELVYEFKPQATGSVTIRLDGMLTDQDLYILQAGCTPAEHCIAESDLASTSVDQVTFDAVAGSTYYVVVENYAGAVGQDGQFSLHFDTGTTGGCQEDCDDTVDNDGDGATDCADSDCAGDPVCCGDADGDGAASAACGGTDCDDTDPNVKPGAPELCNGVDDDCDPATTDGSGEAWFGTACDGGDADLCPEGATVCDGSGPVCTDATGDDVEVCDGVDNDCDGQTDEGVLPTWVHDADKDGYGDPDDTLQACSKPPNYVAAGGDCDDADKLVHPGAVEACNGVDDDCDAGTADGADESWLGAACDGGDADVCPEGTWACTGGSQTCGDVSGDSVEVCNGVDDDCDGQTDEGVLTTYFQDSDTDGYGDPGVTQLACAAPGGYVAVAGDCDDGDVNVHPNAAEVCNGVDDDCSAATPDGQAEPWFGQTCDGPDADLCDEGTLICDGSGSTCSDTTGDTLEVCDGVDNDCDGDVDEGGLLGTYYLDGDGDGFGDPSTSVDNCGAPAGYVDNPLDCDDGNPAIKPGALEACNGVDDDCDPASADGSGETWAGQPCDGPDADQCEEGVWGCSGAAQVCDDASGDTVETCNGVDDDCDGQTDEGVLTTFYQDGDGDGFGNPAATTEACAQPAGFVGQAGDCNDSSGAVNPNAAEVCNGQDDDCDPATADGADEAWLGAGCDGEDTDACAEGTWSCAGGSQVCDDGTGDDVEVCNGVDDDCDGQTDEGTLSTFYQDADGDGFGNPAAPTSACEAPPGYVSNTTDCNDGDGGVHPDAVELCNGVDDDCTAATGDGSGEAWFGDPCDGPDADQCEEGELKCDGAGPLCTDATGDNEELCDGLDNDCDGDTDEGGLVTTFYEDADGDGFGDPASTATACAAPPGFVDDGTDCDDTKSSVSPVGKELCNGIDDDCDPTTSDGTAENCSDGNACTVDACDTAAGACTHEAIEGCCVVDSDCPNPGGCQTAQCVNGSCVAQPLCLALEVCVLGQCTSKCDPLKNPTKCSDTGDVLLQCLTDAVTGDSGWVPSTCEGGDKCAYDESTSQFHCCTPSCEGRECGAPSECMIPCGTCADGWTCAGPNEALEVPGTDPDAFTCVPGCTSVADGVPPEDQTWSVAVPECGPSLPGTENLAQCGGCDGFSACTKGVCQTACDEAGLTASGRCAGETAQWCEDGKPQQVDCAAEGSYCCPEGATGNPTAHAACCSCATECETKGWQCGLNSCGEACGDPTTGDGCPEGFDCQGRVCVCTVPSLCAEPDAGPEPGPEPAAEIAGEDATIGETGVETSTPGQVAQGCSDCSGGGDPTGPLGGAALILGLLLARRRRRGRVI